MTNEELIAKIKAEIERQAKSINTATGDFAEGRRMEQRIILSFISDLESEKPMNLEEEISRTYHDGSVADTFDLDHVSYENIARHFAQWGAEHEKIESEKPVPNDLEEAAVDIADALLAKPKDYVLSAKADYWNGAHDGIIAGSKWQAKKCDEETSKLLYAERQTAYINGWHDCKEQMLKGAVEGTVTCHNLNRYILVSGLDESLTYGDKVRIVVIPNTDEK